MDDGYTSWRGGVTNNKNGTYTINYRIDSQKALLNALSPLEIYVKIDDGTMFNNETMNRYDHWGEELQEEFLASEAAFDEGLPEEDEEGNYIEHTAEEYEAHELQVEEDNARNKAVGRPGTEHFDVFFWVGGTRKQLCFVVLMLFFLLFPVLCNCPHNTHSLSFSLL